MQFRPASTLLPQRIRRFHTELGRHERSEVRGVIRCVAYVSSTGIGTQNHGPITRLCSLQSRRVFQRHPRGSALVVEGSRYQRRRITRSRFHIVYRRIRKQKWKMRRILWRPELRIVATTIVAEVVRLRHVGNGDTKELRTLVNDRGHEQAPVRRSHNCKPFGRRVFLAYQLLCCGDVIVECRLLSFENCRFVPCSAEFTAATQRWNRENKAKFERRNRPFAGDGAETTDWKRHIRR